MVIINTPTCILTETSILYTDGHMDGQKGSFQYIPKNIRFEGYNHVQMVHFLFYSVEKRKYWLPAFSPFPTMISKGFFQRVIQY